MPSRPSSTRAAAAADVDPGGGLLACGAVGCPCHIFSGTGCPGALPGSPGRGGRSAPWPGGAARSLRVLLLQDRVLVVEGVEALRELQGVAGDQRQLQALGGLLDRLADLRHLQDEVPEVLAPQLVAGRAATSSAETSSGRPVLAQAAADVLRPHQRVLEVGARLALEAQGLVEVEGDDPVVGRLDHEEAQGGDGDLVGEAVELASGEVAVALGDLLAALGLSWSMQVVRLDADPLAAGHLQGLVLLLVLVEEAERPGGGRRQGDHLVGEVDRALGLRRGGRGPGGRRGRSSGDSSGGRR